MRIISKTGKEYSTVEECLAAEKEYDEQIAKVKAAEEQKALEIRKEAAITERKEAASKVEEKRQAVIVAQKEYKEELAKFCEKYGAYHYTVKGGDTSIFDIMNSMFDHFWF